MLSGAVKKPICRLGCKAHWKLRGGSFSPLGDFTPLIAYHHKEKLCSSRKHVQKIKVKWGEKSQPMPKKCLKVCIHLNEVPGAVKF